MPKKLCKQASDIRYVFSFGCVLVRIAYAFKIKKKTSVTSNARSEEMFRAWKQGGLIKCNNLGGGGANILCKQIMQLRLRPSASVLWHPTQTKKKACEKRKFSRTAKRENRIYAFSRKKSLISFLLTPVTIRRENVEAVPSTRLAMDGEPTTNLGPVTSVQRQRTHFSCVTDLDCAVLVNKSIVCRYGYWIPNKNEIYQTSW